MTEKEKVSFIIPTFNCAAFLPHAVESCIKQSWHNTEIVIIDDCSTDTTSQYIEWLLKQKANPPIVYKKNDKNMGRSYSRNLGVKLSIGDILCVMDSDDLALDRRAEWTVKKLKNCQVTYGSTMFIDAIGQKVKDEMAKPIDTKNLLLPLDMTKWEEDLRKGIRVDLRESGIVHSSMGMLRDIAVKYPYAEGKISDLGLDDWDMQIRMLKDGVVFDFIPDIICAYRCIGQTVTTTRNQLDVVKMKAELLAGVHP